MDTNDIMILQSFIMGAIGQYIGLSLAVLGILISIFLYFRGKKHKCIQRRKNSISLISDKEIKNIPDIKILYKENEIECLTVSKICVWNAGNEVIRNSDISPTNPLAINIDNDFEFYEYKILSVSDTDCGFSTQQDNKRIVISFAYLEPKQGIVIQITHSGKNSGSLHFSGKIIGGNELRPENDSDDYLSKFEINCKSFKLKISTKLIKGSFFIYGLMMLGAAMFDPELVNKERILQYIIGGVLILTSIIIPTIKDVPTKLKNTFEEG